MDAKTEAVDVPRFVPGKRPGSSQGTLLLDAQPLQKKGLLSDVGFLGGTADLGRQIARTYEPIFTSTGRKGFWIPGF